MNEKFVVIDLETTGHAPVNPDRIIEVGIVVIENQTITNEFATYLNPNKSIPAFITKLTGIHDHDVVNAPVFNEKAEEIKDLFAGGYLVAHNVPFDFGFLNEELKASGFPILHNAALDTVELARILYPQAPGFKLGQLAEYLQIRHDKPHRAISDARMTAQLLLALLRKLCSLPYETIAHLLHLEKNLDSDLYHLLDQQKQKLTYSSGRRTDIDVHRGLAVKTEDDTEFEFPQLNTFFGDYLDAIYETGGAMEQEMVHYEKRTGQRTMSETVYDAFQTKRHALIEAETGTGKSLAYLLSAVYEAVNMKEKVVISTYTTQLQTQLLEEEVPLVRNLVPFSFKIALLKGKQHYISLKKFEQALESQESDNYDLTLTKAMILVWLTETETGDIDEIQLPSAGYALYRQISADAEEQSDLAFRSFYQRACHKAQQADVVITNHALLCTDIFNNFQLLPSYNKAIIDEAHHLEKAASKHYGLELHYVYAQNILSQIGETKGESWLAKQLRDMSTNFPEEKWDNRYSQAKYELDDLFRMLFQYVVDQNQSYKLFSDTGRIQYRFDRKKEDEAPWPIIKEMAARLISYLRELIQLLSLLQNNIEKKSAGHIEVIGLPKHITSLQSVIDRVEKLFLSSDDQVVKWMEIEAYGAKNAVYLYSEPINISELLADDFFNQMESVVLTSATLSIKGSFSYSQKQLGLPSENLLTAKIPSPFPYQEQVQLMIPDDFPDVKNGDQEAFIHSTCEAIMSLAHITDGRMLVLFTSYEMLRKTYTLLSETMDTNTYMLIAQGISSGSRNRLKKDFQSFNQSILLGTSSFWEGVDIPGQDLSCVVIVKLPFEPPNHPVYEAKARSLEKEGGNAFFEMALPNAVIRFKQGFGRLIRSTSDRGIVFVCDRRIKKAQYGKFFLDSIPPVPRTYDSTHELIKKAAEWF